MPSMMAAESEVSGVCVEEIDLSLEIKNGDSCLCFGWK
jgi:hypothetical protein